MLFANIFLNFTGLTNQIFAFITAILVAKKRNEQVIIYNDFLNDINSKSTTPISNIFDFEAMNQYLKSLNIIIFDKNKISSIKLLDIKYGDINLTEELKNKSLLTPTSLDFIRRKYYNKDIFHKLNITFLITFKDSTEYKFIESYDNFNNNNIKLLYNFHNLPFEFTFGWITTYNKILFEEIIINLKFNNYFIEKSNQFLLNTVYKNSTLNESNNININVIHLRLEDDAIKHWSKQNKLAPNIFKAILINKYIEIIKNYVNPNDCNIILSYSTNNGVLDFMKSQNLKYIMMTKELELGREKNALLDYIISKSCNHLFIGNFNMEKLNGSTFSYLIFKSLPITHPIKKVIIDLDHINSPYTVYD